MTCLASHNPLFGRGQKRKATCPWIPGAVTYSQRASNPCIGIAQLAAMKRVWLMSCLGSHNPYLHQFHRGGGRQLDPIQIGSPKKDLSQPKQQIKQLSQNTHKILICYHHGGSRVSFWAFGHFGYLPSVSSSAMGKPWTC